MLESLGLERNGVATNAAVLLLHGRLQALLPQAVIKCARISGSAGFARNPVTFAGTIVEQIDDALAYVLDQTNTVQIGGDPERKVVYQYPPAALREAIVNAVCHRDYAQTDPIHIRLYEDHIEIWNPGELSFGLTVQSLFRDHPSRPRNPKVAFALDKLDYIEQFGSGTLRMAEAMESAGQPPPDFVSQEGVFRVRFYRRSESHPLLNSLTERQQEIMKLLRMTGRLTTVDLERSFHVNRRTIQLDLRRLIEIHLAELRGAGPSAYYQPTDQWRIKDLRSVTMDSPGGESNDLFTASLTSRQRNILSLLQREGRLTVAALEKEFVKNRRTLQLDLRRLVELGFAHMGGAGPATFYTPVLNAPADKASERSRNDHEEY